MKLNRRQFFKALAAVALAPAMLRMLPPVDPRPAFSGEFVWVNTHDKEPRDVWEQWCREEYLKWRCQDIRICDIRDPD